MRLVQHGLIPALAKPIDSFADVGIKHRSALEDRDRELQRLTDVVKQRDAEIRTMKEADAHRTSVLHSAIQTYCSRSPFST